MKDPKDVQVIINILWLITAFYFFRLIFLVPFTFWGFFWGVILLRFIYELMLYKTSLLK
jgi:hypothetical protein